MDRLLVSVHNRRSTVERRTEAVDDATKQRGTDRNHQRHARRLDRHPPADPGCLLKSERPDAAGLHLRMYFEHPALRLDNPERLPDHGRERRLEADIRHAAMNRLDDTSHHGTNKQKPELRARGIKTPVSRSPAHRLRISE